jgi:hypothetical protein
MSFYIITNNCFEFSFSYKEDADGGKMSPRRANKFPQICTESFGLNCFKNAKKCPGFLDKAKLIEYINCSCSEADKDSAN